MIKLVKHNYNLTNLYQVNIGFLIMVIVITSRHLRKQENKSKRESAK